MHWNWTSYFLGIATVFAICVIAMVAIVLWSERKK